MNPLQQSMLAGLDSTSLNQFNKFLSSYTLIDIGTIVSLSEDGSRASVLTNQFVNGQQLSFDNVEVLYIGNVHGAIKYTDSGSLCLILGLKSIMPDTRTYELPNNSSPYSSDGIKIIPVSNAMNNDVKVGFDSDGSFNISNKLYSIAFNPDSVQALTPTGTNIELNQDGSLNMNFGTNILRISIGSSGNCVLQKFNDKNEMTSNLSIDDTGIVTLQNFITLENGEVKTSNSIVMDNTGIHFKDVSENEFVMDSEGVHITDKGAYSYSSEGGITFTAKGPISMTTSTTDLVTVGNEATMKQASKATLGGILNAIVDILINFDTAGSPASHKTGPGTLSKLQYLADDIGAIFG